jgi:tetratricopeptide (TPR) repeat protein
MDHVIEKGKHFIEQGEFQKADEYFNALLEQSEQTFAARLWLARLNFIAGNRDGALQQIQAAEAINPNDSEMKALKGAYYVELEKYSEALPLLESVDASLPDLAFNYTNLANTYRELDRIDEAIEAGTKAVESTPNDASAHFALSQALAVDGKIEDSIYEALETLKLNPKHLMAYIFIGSLYRQAGQTETAMDIYMECVRNLPEAAASILAAIEPRLN